MWLVSVHRLAVRTVVKWSCSVKTKTCSVENCTSDKTIEHLSLECERAVYVWGKMINIGFTINVNYNAIMYGVFLKNLFKLEQNFFWTIICTVVNKLWKTRCAMIIHQVSIPSDVVFMQIVTELKRQKTLDKKQKKHTPWLLIAL